MPRQAANKLNLTKAVIDGLTEPGTYYDLKQPGLCLYVTAHGGKSWCVYKWDRAAKRPVSKVIGKWPAFSVDAARIKARELVHALDRGEVQTGKETSPTLDKITLDFEQALRSTGAKHYNYCSVSITSGCKDWLSRPAGQIDRAQVQERHNQIAAERGPVAALRWVKALNSIYRHADLPSPTAKVRTTSLKPRARVASPDEMARIRAELEKQDKYWRDYFLISILTGARRDNVSSMRFEDVKDGTWLIPAGEAKMGQPIQLPLVDEAAQIIEARRAELKSGYVFPAPSKTGRLHHTWERWDSIRRKAGCPDLTQHDLRRTLISRMAEAGVNPAIAAKAAGHRSVTTTLRVYTVVSQESVLDALKKVT